MADAYRNVNILQQLTADIGTDIVEIYSPGLLNLFDISNGLKYSGFITSLRLIVDISSINQLEVTPTQITDDSQTVADADRDTFTNNPKKCLTLFMKTSTTPLIKIADIFLFNQRPYYYVDLISRFTSSTTFDVANDATIACQIRDAGYGILTGEDRIVIIGCSVEKAPKQDSYLEVYS